MKAGVVLEDERGLEGDVSAHFGQCPYFLIADIDPAGKEVVAARVVPNTAMHGGGGCLAVDEILRHGVTHVIAGGMGMGAQQKFVQAGVAVYGYQGRVKDALTDLLNNGLGGLGTCREPGG